MRHSKCTVGVSMSECEWLFVSVCDRMFCPRCPLVFPAPWPLGLSTASLSLKKTRREKMNVWIYCLDKKWIITFKLLKLQFDCTVNSDMFSTLVWEKWKHFVQVSKSCRTSVFGWIGFSFLYVPPSCVRDKRSFLVQTFPQKPNISLMLFSLIVV